MKREGEAWKGGKIGEVGGIKEGRAEVESDGVIRCVVDATEGYHI